MTDRVVKGGRNDPCPCGSGRKYKNCCIARAVQSKPDVDRLFAEGLGEHKQGRLERAVQLYQEVLAADPRHAAAANNLGACLSVEGKREEALALYRKAVDLQPDYADAWANLGAISISLGSVETALACLNRALALRPASPNALWNRAMCLLSSGRLAEGWEEYEWRWKAALRPRPFHQPRWSGSDPAGKTILVWMEQGLGDHILFASMLPDLLRAGAHCIVECDRRLVGLFERSFPGAEVVPALDPPHPRTQQPDIDFQIPAGSLARWFRPTMDSFPQHGGYLVPDPERIRQWKDRLTRLGEGLKVGICWRSSLNKGVRERHYATLNQWGPILTTPGIQFVNVQYDECGEELREAERMFGARIHAWDDIDLRNDQESVAALITNLDLVLSVSTAVDAMAGAIGARTWVLMRDVSNSFWDLGSGRCPWYPSVRPFYCGSTNPWESVIEKAASELSMYSGNPLEPACGGRPSEPGRDIPARHCLR